MLDKLFLSVLNMSITTSIVIFVVLLVRLLLKKLPKIFSYALWSVVLFRLICPFSFESAIGLLPMNKTPIPQDIVYSNEPQINTGLNIIDNVVNPMLPIPNNTQDSVNPLQIWAFVGSVIWASGILTMLIYSIIQFVRLKRKLIGVTSLIDNIYLADHISSPFVMGFIKPNIYLPSSMAETEQAFIITHEKYHIKRFDHIARILGFIALTIHWFNPLAWLAFALSGKDMEMSCDEAVMNKMGTGVRAEYSEALLRFATGRKFITATPLAFGEGDTKDRVRNVMRYKKPIVGAVIVLTVLLVGLIAILSTNAKQKPTDLVNSIVSIQVNNNVFNPRFYENDFNFNYDELPVLVLSKNNQILPLLLTKEFKKTAYLGFDAYTDGAVVRDTYELSVDDSDTAYLYIGDETQQNTPYLHTKHDYIICYLKSDLHEKAEYVFKIEMKETKDISDFKGVELYVWKDAMGETYFTLLSGTNRNKTEEEIYDKYVATTDISKVANTLLGFDDGLYLFIMQMNETDFTKDEMAAYEQEIITFISESIKDYSISIGVFNSSNGNTVSVEDMPAGENSDNLKAAVDISKQYIENNDENKILDYEQPKVEKIYFTYSHKVFDINKEEIIDIQGKTTYKVTYETEDDPILGPISLYIDVDTMEVLGFDARK